MHETHMIQPVINDVCDHAKKEGAERVTAVRIKIGSFTGLAEESFRQTFGLLAKGTLLEDADLEINFFPAERIELVSFDIE